MPQDLADLLKQRAEAKEFFDKVSYTNKKAYVRWIASAKREETRQRRLQKSIEMILKPK